jgi:carboxymethylenebutenolidase
MTTSRQERVAVDGGVMPAYLALPDVTPAPGLVLFPEIFGVNAHMRQRADELAGLGYATLLPDVFWRTSPGLEVDETTPDALQVGGAAVAGLDLDLAASDGAAALTHLRGLPEVRDAGVFGYCLGGMLAYLVAAAAEPAAAVCYYPSGSHQRLEAAAGIRCPVLFHFGAVDQYLPTDTPERMREATAANPAVEIHVHPGADHAFDNDRFTLHHAEAQQRAAAITAEWLRRTLPRTQ